MKIATWNVNSIRTRQDIVRDWLAGSEVDVLCLQETKVVDPDFPRDPFEKLGYHVYVSGQKAYNGVALFSRQPAENLSVGFADVLGAPVVADLDEQKRAIAATFNGVRVVNLYVPNGGDYDSDKYHYKLRWLGMLRQYVEQTLAAGDRDICMCGDFNIAPDDRDIHTPKTPADKVVGTMPAEREALAAVLNFGLADAFRKFESAGGIFSWWDYRAASFRRNRGWRIDHLYLTPELYEAATSCAIDVEPRKLPKPSDHTPVTVEIDLG
ncbi:MAG: exodeoxyribonuclease III [Geitlerinemataceae cyanobacterium]